ncbi:MAG: hypothetical protein ACK4VY_11305 [Brevundimonas sp.]
MTHTLARLPWSWLWALSIVIVWLWIAHALGQPVPAQQHSLDLVRYGAFRGSDLTLAESWRLIASQWLHVKSGASQAYLALAGLALLTLGWRSAGWWAAVVGVGVALALDLFVSDHAAVKIGHTVPFALGARGGLVLRRWSRARR